MHSSSSRRSGTTRALAVALAALMVTSSLVVGLAATAGTAAAAPTPEFRVEPVADGFRLPTAVEFLPDGRPLVLEKGGTIHVVDPATGARDVYLDLSNRTADRQERGLLNLAFDPAFAANGHLYVYYTSARTGANRISQFTHEEGAGGLDSSADPASEVVVWENPRGADGCCHFGGGLDVGPDGHLYLTTGDEFAPEKAQDPGAADGKIIRVATDGSIPADNPYVGDDDPDTLDAVYAIGLRNPYRAQWDLVGDRLYVGEVGGNLPDSVEDIHVGRPGANYGWPDCEGECADPAYDDPIYSYPHEVRAGGTEPEGAVTVGPVYRGGMFPDEYVGALFYADYVFGWVKYLTFDENGAVVASSDFLTDQGAIVDVREAPDGSLYLVDIAGGDVTRVVYDSTNNAPAITAAAANVTEGDVPLTVAFAGAATDANGDDLTYVWTFGDGATAVGPDVTHTYDVPGEYVASLAVSDGNVTVTGDPIRIVVGGSPTAGIAGTAPGATFRAGDELTFVGTGTDALGRPLPGDSLSWDVVFVHNTHTHPDADFDVTVEGNETRGTLTINRDGHDYSSNTGYRVTLTATDANGVTNATALAVFPEKVNLTLATDPAGLSVDLDAIPRATPYTHDTMIGFEHRVEAPIEQCGLDGTRYVLDGWTDGPTEPVRTVVVPDADVTLTATYRVEGVCSRLPTTGLVTLYESGRGLAADGSQLTGWPDAAGANDLTALGDPQLVADAPELNGRDYVAFDGVDDALVRDGAVGLPTGDADRTVLAVVRYDDVGFGGVGYGRDSGNDGFALGVDDTGDLVLQGWGSANDFPSAERGTGAGWLVQSVRLADDEFTMYRDGVAILSGTHRFTTADDRVVVGANLDERPQAMGVAAVAVYDRALSTTEHRAAASYLAETYLNRSLDVTPTVTVTAPPNGTVAPDGRVTVSWEGTAVATGDHVHLTVDDRPDHVTVDLTGSSEVANLTPGVRTITATVASMGHATYDDPAASDSVQVVVPDPATLPTVTVESPADGATFRAGDELTFVATAVDGSGASLPAGTITWNASLVGDPAGAVPLSVAAGNASATLTIPTDGVAFASATGYRVTATAAEDGVVVADAVTVVPETVALTVGTSAPADAGLAVAVAGVPRATPFAQSALVGVAVRVEAPAAQCGLDGTRYEFDGWSDGAGERARTVAVPAADVALTARYVGAGPCEVLPTAGLALRLETARGLTADDAGLTGWPDLAGATDPTALGDPRVVAGANGTAIVLDGVDDALVRDGPTGLPTGDADRTVLAVVRYDDVGFGGVGYGRDDDNRAFALGVDDTGDLVLQGWGSANDFSSIERGTGTGWLVQSARLKDDRFAMYRDGQEVLTGTHRFDTAADRLVVGANADGDPLGMGVAAVVVYDRALNRTEHDAAVAYLTATYLADGLGPAPAPAPAPAVALVAPADGARVDRNATLTVEAAVTNGGDAALNATADYRIDLDGDGLLGVDETLASRPVALAPGGAATVSFGIVPSALGLAAGDYRHGVAVDAAVDARDLTLAADGDLDPFAGGVPGVSRRPPTDLDGDGRYEDVDGDGDADFLDVVALLFADDEAINADPTMIPGLDFNGNGRLDFLDVVDLLFRL